MLIIKCDGDFWPYGYILLPLIGRRVGLRVRLPAALTCADTLLRKDAIAAKDNEEEEMGLRFEALLD